MIGTMLTFAIGYFVGLKTEKEDLSDLTQALKALRESDQFAGVVVAARSHLGHSMRALADALDGGARLGTRKPGLDDEADLVARVKDLFAADSGH